jgi:hypothetical protein
VEAKQAEDSPSAILKSEFLKIYSPLRLGMLEHSSFVVHGSHDLGFESVHLGFSFV